MRHCQLVLVRAPKVEPTNVPTPDAAISAASPEPPTPSSSRASMTSPTLTMPTARTAPVEEASSSRTPRSATISRAPARMDSSSDPAVRRPGALSGSVARSAADTVNVAALTAIRMCGSTTTSSAPASAGPSVSPRSSSAEYRLIAAGRSDAGTSRETEASAVGLNSAVPMPATSAQAIISPSEGTSASAPNAPSRTTSAATSDVRRGSRSASAPSSGPSTTAGSSSHSSTAVSAQGVW